MFYATWTQEHYKSYNKQKMASHACELNGNIIKTIGNKLSPKKFLIHKLMPKGNHKKRIRVYNGTIREDGSFL